MSASKDLIFRFCNLFDSTLRRGARAVERARLESECALTGYRGFESLPLRKKPVFCFIQETGFFYEPLASNLWTLGFYGFLLTNTLSE